MQLGQIVQGHRITHHLGDGGMASVWRAVHVADGRPVAIKVFDEKLARNPLFRQRFFAEAEHQSKLRHPHVVRVDQVLLEPLALVMEWVEGGSLAAELRRARPDLTRVRSLMAGITAGVGAAHQLNILHRDLKPHNVLLAADGTPKVADFGLARVAGTPGHTLTGQVMGTPKYMAPEQVRGLRQIDLRADVYALGVILFQMLTGRVPFEGSDYQLALAHVQTPPPDPRTLVPEVPAALVDVVRRALAKDPADRPADALALGALIEHAFERPASAGEPWPPGLGDETAPLSGPETTEETAPPSLESSPDEAATSEALVSTALFGAEATQEEVPLATTEHLQSPPEPEPSRRPRRWLWALAAALVLAVAGVRLSFAEPPSDVAAPRSAAPSSAVVAVPASEVPMSKAAPASLGGADAPQLDVDPQDYDALMQRSIDLLVRGQRLRAVAHLRAASALKPEAPQPHQRLCAILPMAGDVEGALHHCKVWHDREANPLYRDRAATLMRELQAPASEPEDSTIRIH